MALNLPGRQEAIQLKTIALALCSAVCVTVLTAVAALAQQPASTSPAPVPPAIRAARKIFVSNGGADSGLFPSPFSGDPNRGYNQLYAGLKAAGQYQLVGDPADADLVLELQLIAPNGPSNADKQKGASDPLPMFRLVVYDRRTHYVLWAITESIAIAFLQKNHDRNFDDALTAILVEFEALTGQPPAGLH